MQLLLATAALGADSGTSPPM